MPTSTQDSGPRTNGFWRFEFWGSDELAELRRVRALFEAEGFSLGRRQRGAPTGILYGDYAIQKWRNLRAEDRAALHGTLDEDIHPITARFRAGLPDEVDDALQRVNERDFASRASLKSKESHNG